MSLYTFIFPLLTGTDFLNASPLNLTGNAAGGRTLTRAYAAKVRNDMRNGDGRGNNWNAALPAAFKVSDVAEVLISGDIYFYMFEVKNTALNKSWLFVIPGRDGSGNVIARGDLMQPGGAGAGANYVQNTAGAPAVGAISTSPTVLVFFNTDPATSDYGMAFNDAVNMTYTTGDFTAPASANLPWNTPAKMNAFLPSHNKNARGAYIDVGSFSGSFTADILVVLSDNAGEAGVYGYLSSGGDREIANMFGIGDFATSITPGDTFLTCMFWAYLTYGSGGYGVPGGTGGNGFVDGRTSAGVAKNNWQLTPLKSLTFANRKDGAGNFTWWRVRIVEGANDKGHIKAGVIREIGGFNIAIDFRSRFAAPAGNCMVKYTNSWAVCYPANVPNFPFEWNGRAIDTP